MTKLLITGALGHIGSRFIHSIQPDDWAEVRMIDDMSSQRFVSLFDLPADVNFSFVEGSILDQELDKWMNGIDIVIHLAAITDAQSSIKNPEQVKIVNYEGTKIVAKACARNGARLFFPSTTSVYGSQDEIVDETCEELIPQSPYAESKLLSEEILKQYSVELGLEFSTCRLGTIFGTAAGMRFHTAVNRFCWQAVMGQKLTVWKTALYQQRPYLGVSDAVRAIKYFCDNNIFSGETYNVVSSNNSVHDIIEAIRKFVPSIRIQYVNDEIMNQLSYHVRSEKLESIGFYCRDQLENGIRDTVSLLSNSNFISGKSKDI
jgi:nucleoside-diphosphate-sugar epimerase